MSESLDELQPEWDEAYYASRGLAAEFVIAPNPKVAKALIGTIGNDELLWSLAQAKAAKERGELVPRPDPHDAPAPPTYSEREFAERCAVLLASAAAEAGTNGELQAIVLRGLEIVEDTVRHQRALLYFALHGDRFGDRFGDTPDA